MCLQSRRFLHVPSIFSYTTVTTTGTSPVCQGSDGRVTHIGRKSAVAIAVGLSFGPKHPHGGARNMVISPSQQPVHGHAQTPCVLRYFGRERNVVKCRSLAVGGGVLSVKRLIWLEAVANRLRTGEGEWAWGIRHVGKVTSADGVVCMWHRTEDCGSSLSTGLPHSVFVHAQRGGHTYCLTLPVRNLCTRIILEEGLQP